MCLTLWSWRFPSSVFCRARFVDRYLLKFGFLHGMPSFCIYCDRNISRHSSLDWQMWSPRLCQNLYSYFCFLRVCSKRWSVCFSPQFLCLYSSQFCVVMGFLSVCICFFVCICFMYLFIGSLPSVCLFGPILISLVMFYDILLLFPRMPAFQWKTANGKV